MFQNFHRNSDSSVHVFYYNTNQSIFKREEFEGPFNFNYYFIYNKNQLKKELKIDGNSESSDTSYTRYYEHKISDNKHEVITLNTIRKPFKIQVLEFNSNNQIINSQINFNKTANYDHTDYKYDSHQLIEKTESSYFGSKNVKLKWIYTYKKGILDEINLLENEKLVKKWVILYLDSKVIDVIVERDLTEQKVNLYKFRYNEL